MNADVAPMNADTSLKVFVPGAIGPRNEAMETLKPLSALVGVTSAFIGVSKDFLADNSPPPATVVV